MILLQPARSCTVCNSAQVHFTQRQHEIYRRPRDHSSVECMTMHSCPHEALVCHILLNQSFSADLYNESRPVLLRLQQKLLHQSAAQISIPSFSGRCMPCWVRSDIGTAAHTSGCTCCDGTLCLTGTHLSRGAQISELSSSICSLDARLGRRFLHATSQG